MNNLRHQTKNRRFPARRVLTRGAARGLAMFWMLLLLWPARADTDQFIEESRQAENLLKQLESQLAAGECESAALIIGEIVTIGPEAVLPETGRGVLLSLRELLYRQPPEVRDRLDAAMAPDCLLYTSPSPRDS